MLAIESSTSSTPTLSCAVFKLVSPRSCAVTVRARTTRIRAHTSHCVTTDAINDTYACENDKMMNDVLKREFGFQGYVMSDWQAHHSTMAAVTGLDVSGHFLPP